MKFVVSLVVLCLIFDHGESNRIKNAANKLCDDVTLPLTKLGDKSYYVETIIRANWYAAMHFCNAHNMRLATIMDANENQLLAEHLKTIGYVTTPLRYVWVAGSDLAKQYNWVWSTTGTKITYTNWGEGEPNNITGKERCVNIVLLEDDLVWNDEDCTEKELNFICEARLSSHNAVISDPPKETSS